MTTNPTVDPNAVTLATSQIVSVMAPTYNGLITNLIKDVRRALMEPIEDPKPEPAKLEPAVPIRRSVQADAIICLECGLRHTSIKRHLKTSHNLTPEAYREKWSLPADYPMVTAAYSARRSQLAKDHGLGRK